MRRSELFPFLFAAVGVLSAGLTNPLQEDPLPGPVRLTDFTILEDRPGNNRDPGSFSFSFRLLDKNGDIYPLLAAESVRLKAGTRDISRFLLTPAAGRYEVRVPRLPLQNQNGRFDLGIRIEENGALLTTNRPAVLRYSRNTIDIILIIDTSTSMRLSDPSGQRRKALESVLRTGRREGIVSRMALVKFSTTSELLCGFTEVSRSEVFQKALNGIDAYGETAIGSGLATGLQEILKHRGANRVVAVLLTDGENNGPWNQEHLGFKKAGVPLHVIGLTSGVDNAFLDRIGRETGGEYYPAPDGFSLTSIYQRIVQKEANRRVITEESVVLPPGAIREWDLLSRTGSKRVHAVVSSEHPLDLTTPEGTDSIFADPSGGFWSFSITDQGASGKIRLKNTSRRTNRVELTGFIRSGLNISFSALKKAVNADEPVALSCLAFQDDQPLRDCRIEAALPGTSGFRAILRDDGLHNDGGSDDGLYRAYLPPLPPGRHLLKLTAEGRNLLSEPFQKKESLVVFVGTEKGRTLSLKPIGMGFSRTGKNADHFRSFEAVQSRSSNLTVRVIPLPLDLPSRDGKAPVPVHVAPAACALEPDRRKLFNLSVRFGESSPDGIYSGAVILESEEESLYVPYQVEFDRYRIMDSGEKR